MKEYALSNHEKISIIPSLNNSTVRVVIDMDLNNF